MYTATQLLMHQMKLYPFQVAVVMATQEDSKQVIEVSEVIDTSKRDSNPVGMYVALDCT